jgi:serine/threonine-protein kinase HipA
MSATCVVFDCRQPAAPVPVGSFGLDELGDGHFAYGRHYVDKAVAFDLDPIHLPRSVQVQRVPRHPGGSYGVLSDAGPNAWGMKLTASLLRRRKQPLPANPVEWLLQSWHYGSGCLGFSRHRDELPGLGVVAAAPGDLSAKLLRALDRLSTDPDAVLTDADARLLVPGASLGGVRPKTVVLHGGREHIAKFSRPDDVFDVPSAEYATMALAHRAGVATPDFELIDIGGRSAFLIERFDRTATGERRHYLGAFSLLAPTGISADRQALTTRYSYAGIAEAMRPLNINGVEDSHQLFRRMVFNILVGNVDDHLRNHALLMAAPGRFVLSPAFDIVPHPAAAAAPQSIGVGRSARPARRPTR